MAYRCVSVDIDVDLDEFSNSELINEIKYRHSKGLLSETERIIIITHLQNGGGDKKNNSTTSLNDVIKLEIIEQYLQSHTIFELEKRLSY